MAQAVPILIGAAIGGGTAALTGGDIAQGALIGGVTGGFGGFGTAAGSTLAGGVGPTQGSGIVGAFTGGGKAALFSGGTGLLGGGGSSFSKGLNILSAGTSLLGTASSVRGVQIQTQQAVSQAQSAAGISDFNAEVSRQNAEQARVAAIQDAIQLRTEARRKVSTIRARLAASGVVTTVGSSLLVQAEQEREGAFAAERRLYSGELEARGFETQATLDTFKADVARSNIGAEKAAGKAAVGSSLLSGFKDIVTIGTSIL